MPVYLFFGEEEYLLDKEIQNLKKTVLNNEASALNYMKHDNPSGKILQEILLSNPMLFGNTLHIIKFNKTLVANQKGGISEGEIDDVIDKLERVNPNVHVVFTCATGRKNDKKPDQRKKIFKALNKFGTVKNFPVQFQAYNSSKYTPIIQKMAKEKGITITNDAIKCLVETAGVYLMDIDSQLEKLKLLAHPKTSITLDMIKEISIVNEDIFKVVDLIIENKTTEALSKISNMLDKSHYLQILSTFQTNFLKLLQTKVYSDMYPSSEVAKLTGQSDGQVYMTQKKLGNISLKRLIELKQNLSIAEFKLKTGEYEEPILAFERIISGGKLC